MAVATKPKVKIGEAAMLDFVPRLSHGQYLARVSRDFFGRLEAAFAGNQTVGVFAHET